jgi:hypothetical protein
MLLRRHALPLAAAALLAVPATAAAQGASDNQYSDPFGNQAPPTATHHHASTTHHATVTPATTSAPTVSATPPASSGVAASSSGQSNPTATTSSTASADPSSTLPRTGFDATEELLLGGILLAAGLTIRWRLRRTPR